MTYAWPLLASAIALAAPPSVDEVLTNIRRAINYDRLAKSPAFELRGTTNRFGVDAEYRLLFDAAGRFREQIDGKLGETTGFDGTTAWISDWSRATRRLDLRDREVALASAWLRSGRWLAHDGPFDISIVENKTTDKDVVLQLRFRDEAFTTQVTVDRASWLPRRTQTKARGDSESAEYSDYRPVDGLMIAHYVKSTTEGQSDRLKITAAMVLPTADEGLFRFTPRVPDNVRFDPSKPAQLETKHAKTGHLLVRPRINGQDVGWFIFDSGAGLTAIDSAVADKLGLERVGDVPAVGMGGTVKTHLRQDKSLQLGPLTATDNLYVELDLRPFAKVMGDDIAGVIGYPVLQASVVEIEVATPAVSLHDPTSFKLSDGKWEPLLLNNNHPCCNARFEGDREGVFRLDTGAMGTLSFHAPAVKKLDLLKGRKTRMALEGGVGGMKTARSGRLDWFELGGHRFDRPRVTFSTASSGALVDDYTVGNIGQDFMKPFRLVLWYGENKIAFAPLGRASIDRP